MQAKVGRKVKREDSVRRRPTPAARRKRGETAAAACIRSRRAQNNPPCHQPRLGEKTPDFASNQSDGKNLKKKSCGQSLFPRRSGFLPTILDQGPGRRGGGRVPCGIDVAVELERGGGGRTCRRGGAGRGGHEREEDRQEERGGHGEARAGGRSGVGARDAAAWRFSSPFLCLEEGWWWWWENRGRMAGAGVFIQDR